MTATATAAEIPRAELNALVRASKAYDALNAALVELAAHPDDPHTRLLAARDYLLLGIGAPARELLESADAATQRDPEFQQSLERIPISLGRQSWASRRNRFEANLAALAGRRVETQAIEARWKTERARFDLFTDARGVDQVRYRPADGPAVWLPFLGDHAALAEAAPPPPGHDRPLPGPYLFEGLDLGWYFERVWRQTHDTYCGYSSALYLVESEPALVALVLHLHEWSALLADERVHFFLGDDAADRFRQALVEDASLPAPEQVFQLSKHRAVVAPDAGAAAAAAITTRQERAAADLATLEERYRGRDARYWARRFDEASAGSGPPLRILATASRYTTFLQHSMRDVKRAAEKLGHEFRLLIEPTPFSIVGPSTYHAEILRFDPDLFFVLDHLRSSFHGLLPANLPFLSWDQDSLPWVFDPAKDPQLAWNDFLAGHTAGCAASKFGWPAHRCHYCGLAGSPETYSAEPLPPETLAPYRCDVSYVCHSSQTVPEKEAELEAWLPDDRLRSLFRTVAAKLVPVWLAGGDAPGPMTAIVDMCRVQGVALTVDEWTKVGAALGRLGDLAFRHTALTWIADWADRTGRALHVWGKGWDRHPRFARYARGPAANGHELRCIYQASRINLQLTCYGFLHQRALDGLMAGAFFLTRPSQADTGGPVLRELLDLLDRHAIYDATALAVLPDAQPRRRIEACLLELSRDPRVLTPPDVDTLRLSALATPAAELVPHFNEIAFTCADGFAAAAERFLGDDDTRRRHASEIRAAVVDRFSYRARMSELLAFVGEGLQTEAQATASAEREPLARSRAGTTSTNETRGKTSRKPPGVAL